MPTSISIVTFEIVLQVLLRCTGAPGNGWAIASREAKSVVESPQMIPALTIVSLIRIPGAFD
jgi:hypothetical protein